MASFKSVPWWRSGTIGCGSWRTANKSVRIIEMRSVADIIGKGQDLIKDLIVLLVRVARVAGM